MERVERVGKLGKKKADSGPTRTWPTHQPVQVPLAGLSCVMLRRALCTRQRVGSLGSGIFEWGSMDMEIEDSRLWDWRKVA